MAQAKVTDADLRAYLDAGHSQAATAWYFGVSEPAIISVSCGCVGSLPKAGR